VYCHCTGTLQASRIKSGGKLNYLKSAGYPDHNYSTRLFRSSGAEVLWVTIFLQRGRSSAAKKIAVMDHSARRSQLCCLKNCCDDSFCQEVAALLLKNCCDGSFCKKDAVLLLKK